MNTEAYITAICLIAAATIITISFRLAHWRNRAEHWRTEYIGAKMAIARIEETIAVCSADTVKAVAMQAVMELAPVFREQAVNATMQKLRRPEQHS